MSMRDAWMCGLQGIAAGALLLMGSVPADAAPNFDPAGGGTTTAPSLDTGRLDSPTSLEHLEAAAGDERLKSLFDLRATGDLETARAELRAYISESPGQVPLLITAFTWALDAEDVDAARQRFEQARALRPDDNSVRAIEGVLLAHQGDAAKAVQHLEALLVDDPDNSVALQMLAEIYRQNWYVQRANTLYQRLVQTYGVSTGTVPSLLQWTGMLLDHGQVRLAQELLEALRGTEGLLVGPSIERWTLLASRRALAAGNGEAAERILSRQSAWTGERAAEAEMLGARAAWAARKDGAAISRLEAIAATPSLTLRVRRALASIHADRGDVAAEARELGAALAVAQRYDHLRTLDRLVATLLKADRMSDAVAQLQTAAEQFPEEPSYKLIWADLLVQRKMHREAKALLDAANQQHAGHSNLLYLSGINAFFMGDKAAAETAMRASVEADPDNSRAWISLAKLAHERGGHGGVGRHVETLAIYEEALKRSPGNAVVMIEMGRIAVEEGRTADGIRHFREAIAAAPGDHIAASELAVLLAQQDGGMVEAEALAARAVQLAPQHVVSLFARGRILLWNKQYGEAARTLDDANAVRPVHGHSLAYAARAYQLEGEPAKARERANGALQRALRENERQMAHEVLLELDGKQTVEAELHRIDDEGVHEVIGRIVFTDRDDGVDVAVEVSGLPAGESGIHVHEHPSCAPVSPTGKAGAGLGAGAHFGEKALGISAGHQHHGGHGKAAKASDGEAASAEADPHAAHRQMAKTGEGDGAAAEADPHAAHRQMAKAAEADKGDSGGHGGHGAGHHGEVLPIGDLPNLLVRADGTASTTLTSDRLRAPMVKGRSVMIHAATDGARVACAVIL